MSVHEQRYYGPERRAPHPVKSDNYQRASDAERQAVVEQLRLNCGEGRISIDEFGERTTRALAAQTGGELRALLNDLPIVPVPASPQERADRKRKARMAVLIPYLTVNAFLVLIWLVSSIGDGELHGFWPIWPILGWGIGVVFALLGISRSDGQRYPDQGYRPGFDPGRLNR